MLKAGNSGVRIQIGARDFCPKRPERLWGPTSLLFNEYRGYFPGGQSGRRVTLTIHLQLFPRLRMSGAVPLLPLYALIMWEETTS